MLEDIGVALSNDADEEDDNEPHEPSTTSDSPVDDEDIQAGVVTDADCVFADVKLAAKPRQFPSDNLLDIFSYPEGRKWDIETAVQMLELPEFPQLIRKFLNYQLYPDTPDDILVHHDGKIRIFYSATATFRAPSDPSGIRSMRREQIRATPSWRNGAPRYDCAFMNCNPGDEDAPLHGLEVGRIFLFFCFVHQDTLYSCALVQWYSFIGDKPDEDTGMWLVEPDIHSDGSRLLAVIHIDAIYRAAHLMPAYRNAGLYVDRSLRMHDSLDSFDSFYINKFADHNSFEITS